MEKIRLAMFVSGGATTAASIYKAILNGSLKNVEPVLVIRSKEEAGRALIEANYPQENIITISRKDYLNEEEWTERLLVELKKQNVNLIGQFGWLKKTPSAIIKTYKGRIINQHPGPLQNNHLDFGGKGMFGLRVHAARLYFVQKTRREFWTEATTHFVTEEYDEGKVIKTKRVEIKEDDTPETLQARVLPFEHSLQIEVLKDFADNSVTLTESEQPLVLPHEVKILEECKQEAIKNYPNG